MLALPQDLKASRAILVIALLVGLFAILAGFAGGKCTNCLVEGSGKGCVAMAAGALLMTAGLLAVIPPSWAAHWIITDFYTPLVAQALKRELGQAIFIGWALAVLMLIGGGLFCASCPQRIGALKDQYKITPSTRMGTEFEL